MRKEIEIRQLPGGGIYKRTVIYIGPHGGRRAGSGRKKMNPEGKRPRLSKTVSPETMTFLEEMSSQPLCRKSYGEVVDILVAEFLKKSG